CWRSWRRSAGRTPRCVRRTGPCGRSPTKGRCGMAMLEVTEIELRQETSPEVFHRGEEYFQRGAVEALVRRGDRLEADVWGSDVRPYRVGVPLTKGGLAMATCTCPYRSEEHTSELQSQSNLVCRLLLEKK